MVLSKVRALQDLYQKGEGLGKGVGEVQCLIRNYEEKLCTLFFDF